MKEIVERLLKNKKTFLLKAEGSSMLPLLKPGDVLYLIRIIFQRIKINDIVMVQKKGKIFTHRVIYKKILKQVQDDREEYLVTKGDNNPQSDGKIKPGQIIGKVYQIKRNGQIIKLENFYLFQSTLYFQEIVKVKKYLDRKKVNFVFLKGLPIHLYYERKHPARIYADCDLLINKFDYEKAEKVFKNLNYTKAITEFSEIHKSLKDKPTEFSFYKKVNDFPVVFDIHLEPVFLMNQIGRLDVLYPQKLLDSLTEELLNTKRKIIVNKESFLILNTQYLILYLALHFFHHNFRGIHRLEMIDKVIRKNHDWIILEQRIKHYHVENFVYPVFLMLHKYFDTPLPRGFLSSIRPKEDKLRYIKKNVMKINVFDDEARIQAGIYRFKNIFFLSPEPVYKKVLVFLNPAVEYSILWVLYKKLKAYFMVTFAPSSLARARK